MDPYKIKIGGVVADPYRIAIEYGLDPILGQALKKILRCGRKHKSAEEDAKEVITTMERWLEIQRERAHEAAIGVDFADLCKGDHSVACVVKNGVIGEVSAVSGIKTNMEKILDERAGETNWP